VTLSAEAPSGMTALRNVLIRFLRGSRKTAVFAITTRCNCRCLMCDMHRKPPETISLSDAKRILDFLRIHGFLIVYFTGGEPTLHPDISRIVGYADKLGMATTVTTNGTVEPDVLKALKEAGLHLLSVSVDHWDPQVCEKIRGYRGILARQEKTIKLAREANLRAYGLTFLNPFLIDDGVEKLVRFVNEEMMVPFGFCYPTASEVNSYCLGGVLRKHDFTKRLEESVDALLSLKRAGRPIANLGTYIEDAKRLQQNRRPNFYCKGGEDVIYVDWLGDVYPCFHKGKLFNILKAEKPRFLRNVRCNECLTNCFREPSILTQMFTPPHVLVKEFMYSHNTRRLFI